MHVLWIDSSPPPDSATMRKLQLRGYEVVTAGAKREAMEWIGRTGFDLILVAVPSSATEDFGDLTQIRRLARTSAVALMTTGTTAPFFEEALIDGRIERAQASSLMTRFAGLFKPVLIGSSKLSPVLIQEMRSGGLDVQVANTLQFAVELLVDGRGQVIVMKLDVPGLEATEWAIFHRVDLIVLTFLAAASRGAPSAIVHCAKPQNAVQFIELFEFIAATCPTPCGLTEHFGQNAAETEAFKNSTS